jgi:crotonobetaine/carnitine-CoA ligase
VAERYGVEVTARAYGQTECFPVTYSPLRESSSTNPASCGRASPDLDVFVIDPNGEPVAPGTVGEIVAKPQARHAVFAGYWNEPLATERAFQGGWYHTGDAGVLEPDGTLTFVDRKENVLRRRGENISSLELEASIASIPGIAEVAAFAVPSDVLEDDVMVTVVLEPGKETTPAELFALLRADVPYFAIPRYVDIAPALPKNALDRVMKSTLRERGVTETTWDFGALGLAIARDERRGTPSSGSPGQAAPA